MWIFLNNAFVSIVAHRTRASMLLVRARKKGDIQRAFPGAKVKRTPNADYLYRAEIDRELVAIDIAFVFASMTYDNLKGSVDELARHDVYMKVWRVMRQWQDDERMGLPPRPFMMPPSIDVHDEEPARSQFSRIMKRNQGAKE